MDPSRPGASVGRYRNASPEEIHRAIIAAVQDADGWRKMSSEERREILHNVAQEIRKARADLMGAALANTGKTLGESDPEVSEAIDFCEFYPASALEFAKLPGVTATGRGVVVVIPPWNFPIAIPCGGIAAALAAGNTVILKPATPAVLVAWQLCLCFWRAGVSKRALQFVPCAGDQGGQILANHPDVQTVILTGGTATALEMLQRNPNLHLCAETGRKNATIVTALSDRDQAIKNVLHSAFSHAGQKCSAMSLLLLEAEVYDDSAFRRALVEAAASIHAGSAWDLKTKMGPLIHPPKGDLENALKTLGAGESWALMPSRIDDENPNLWSPGIKYGVQSGSYSHLTEFFGPVLSVMRYNKLHEAVAMVNQTGYGLTSGLETLDEREQDEWRHSVRAGNLYINRSTTGAIVLRQPFGGMGKSSFGPGLKAGGPNYVAQLMRFEEAPIEATTSPAFPELKPLLSELDFTQINGAIHNYRHWVTAYFSKEHDHFRLVGQDNFRRYLPIRDIRVRAVSGDSRFSLFARAYAALLLGCHPTISYSEWTRDLELLQQTTENWAGGIEFIEETDAELIAAILDNQVDRLRYAAPNLAPSAVRAAAHDANVPIIDTPVLAEGRIELLWYLQEQSISREYHRYGNLGSRATEPRRAVL